MEDSCWLARRHWERGTIALLSWIFKSPCFCLTCVFKPLNQLIFSMNWAFDAFEIPTLNLWGRQVASSWCVWIGLTSLPALTLTAVVLFPKDKNPLLLMGLLMHLKWCSLLDQEANHLGLNPTNIYPCGLAVLLEQSSWLWMTHL